MLWWSIPILLIQVCFANNGLRELTQGNEIWGYIYPHETKLDVLSSCFKGFNNGECVTVDESSDAETYLSVLEDATKVQLHLGLSLDLGYTPFVENNSNGPYCLSCCSNSLLDQSVNFDANGKLAPAAGTIEKVYVKSCPRKDTEKADRYEFVFRKRPAITDQTEVRCGFNTTDVPLVGFHLKLVVKEYSDGLGYWRGVERCEVEKFESSVYSVTKSYQFFELYTLYMDNHAKSLAPQIGSLLLFILSIYNAT